MSSLISKVLSWILDNPVFILVCLIVSFLLGVRFGYWYERLEYNKLKIIHDEYIIDVNNQISAIKAVNLNQQVKWEQEKQNAIDEYNAKVMSLTSDLDSANKSINSLRDAVNTVHTRTITKYTKAACPIKDTTDIKRLGELLVTCSERYRDMAATADGYRLYSEELIKAWPTKQ